jgi:hypothetical protein
MKTRYRILAALLALSLCLGLAACGAEAPAAPAPSEAEAAADTAPAEAPAEPEPTESPVSLPGLSWPVEEAEGPTAVSYPYVVRTETAVWHLSKDDMELLGEEAYCQGLENLLQCQEADFTDARTVLAPWLQEEVPPIDIYTDFCGHAEGDEIFGAFYYGARREIRLFHDWDYAARSLLHEYVHYLTFTCADRPTSAGLFGEGVAEYVSHFACRNRMDREASKRALSGEELQMAAECHLLDEDGCMDPARSYLYNAEMIRSPMAIGAKYSTITSAMMTRSERINESPSYTTISYYEAGCFLAFLVESYGEEQVFSHWGMDPFDLKEVFGKDFGELYREWAAWNRAQCDELGISFG